jgi:hypothetical protein
MTDKQDGLQNHVNSIAESLTNPPEPVENEYGEMVGDAYDWLNDVLDIEFMIASDRETVLGARILVAFGGPNIWVNTRTNEVEGYWWGESAKASFVDNLGIGDAVADLFHC